MKYLYQHIFHSLIYIDIDNRGDRKEEEEEVELNIYSSCLSILVVLKGPKNIKFIAKKKLIRKVIFMFVKSICDCCGDVGHSRRMYQEPI